MKRNKKLRKGMTLVEVVVAMTVFAILSLGVSMTMCAAVKAANRNKQRDVSVGKQAENVSNKNSDGTSVKGGKLVMQFTDSSGNVYKVNSDKNVYQSSEEEFSGKFGFNLKTISDAGAFGVTMVTPAPSDTKHHRFDITNNSTTDSITVRLTIPETETGNVYEGDPVYGYIHTAKTYTITVEPGLTRCFGYEGDSTKVTISAVKNSSVPVSISAPSPTSSSYQGYTFDGASFTRADK